MAELNWRRGIQLAALALFALGLGTTAGIRAGDDARAPDLGDCDELAVGEGHRVCFHAYAEGVQIYRWNGTAWSFVAPEAWLYDQDGEVVAIHYGGPTWESESGSFVIGEVLKKCTPDPDSIPWLKLGAVRSDGPGIFDRVSYIQRVNTEGGLPPSEPGEVIGEVARVPYTADYYFYRATK